MSRLYLVGNSDTKKGFSSTGNISMNGELLWGSKYDPKTCVAFEVTWALGSDVPELIVTIGKGIDIQIKYDG